MSPQLSTPFPGEVLDARMFFPMEDYSSSNRPPLSCLQFIIIKFSNLPCLTIGHQTLLIPEESRRKECCREGEGNVDMQALLDVPSLCTHNHAQAIPLATKPEGLAGALLRSRTCGFLMANIEHESSVPCEAVNIKSSKCWELLALNNQTQAEECGNLHL